MTRLITLSAALGLVLTSMKGYALPPNPDVDAWNKDPDELKTYNCYNYAVNKKTPGEDGKPRRANPGKGKAWPDLGKEKTVAQLCDTARPRAKDDGLKEITWNSGDAIPTPPDGQNLVAFMAKAGVKGKGGDVHWWRKNGDGSWSHKPGSSKATKSYDDSGTTKDLTDPRDSAQTAGYTICGFMAIVKNTPPDIGPLVALADPCRGRDGTVVLVSVESSSFPDPETVVRDPNQIAQLSQHMPTISLANQTTDPHWELLLPGAHHGYLVLADPAVAPNMLRYMRVYQSKVEVPTGDPGNPYNYYNDDRGLESLVAALFNPAEGACCVPQSDCAQTTECTCTEMGSNYTFDGAPCGAGGSCIPTVSEWGLVIMTLTSLVCGTIVIGQSRSARA